jgi:hypothetical protein
VTATDSTRCGSAAQSTSSICPRILHLLRARPCLVSIDTTAGVRDEINSVPAGHGPNYSGLADHTEATQSPSTNRPRTVDDLPRDGSGPLPALSPIDASVSRLARDRHQRMARSPPPGHSLNCGRCPHCQLRHKSNQEQQGQKPCNPPAREPVAVVVEDRAA